MFYSVDSVRNARCCGSRQWLQPGALGLLGRLEEYISAYACSLLFLSAPSRAVVDLLQDRQLLTFAFVLP